MNSIRFLESHFLSEFTKLYTILSSARNPAVYELRRARGRFSGVYFPPIEIANSIAELVQVQRVISPITDALELDRLLPSHPRGILEAFGDNSRSVATSLARIQKMDQLRKIPRAAEQAFLPSMCIANSIVESVCATEAVSRLTGALDLLLPSHLQDIMAASGENFISMARLAGSQVWDQLRST